MNGQLRITIKNNMTKTKFSSKKNCMPSYQSFKSKKKSRIGICFTKAATTSPCSFRTKTPIPAALKSSKISPSKFTFTKLASWGFHRGLCARTFLLGQRRTCWNSCKWHRATPAILFNGQTPSPTRSLFRRLQILQHVITNTSAFNEEQNTSSSRSQNELTLEKSTKWTT